MAANVETSLSFYFTDVTPTSGWVYLSVDGNQPEQEVQFLIKLPRVEKGFNQSYTRPSGLPLQTLQQPAPANRFRPES